MLSSKSITCATFVVIIAIIYAVSDRMAVYPVHSDGLVILTGATSGLGKHAAIELAKMGYTVLAGARNQRKADALRAEVSDKNFIPVMNTISCSFSFFFDCLRLWYTLFDEVVLEVTNSEHIQNLVNTVDSYDMPLVALVNNAAVADVTKVGNYDMPWQKTMYDINVIAPIELVNVLWRKLIESKGRIVNVGSVEAESSSVTNTYAGTKAAIKAISHNWRREGYKYGVSVSLVQPGAIKSNMCDLEKFCDSSAKDTTTPSYVHAITNPRPKSVYITGNFNFIPAAWYVRLFHSLPYRVSDYAINAMFSTFADDAGIDFVPKN